MRVHGRKISGTGAGFAPVSRFLFLTLAFAPALLAGCALFYTRPVQEMSDTSAAIRSAREVQADSLAPDLFREANEWFTRARREYRFKNFKLAYDFANKARNLAEKAEFEALRKGAVRTEIAPPPEEVGPSPSPYAYPTPEGTPADEMDQKKSEEPAPQTAPPPAGR
jgi:hypothetical protein